jgi:hypothetical protein
VFFYTAGEVQVRAVLGTTLNYSGTPDGIRYAVSFDDEAPQIVNSTAGVNPDNAVMDNAVIKITKHKIAAPGAHTLKIWAVDPGFVLQKIVIDTGTLRPSYLGPLPSPVQP